MKLKEEFSLSRFAAESKEILKKDTVVFAGAGSSIEKLYEMNEGYDESTAYKGDTPFFKIRKDEAWKKIPAVQCYRNANEIFGSGGSISIPVENLSVPKIKE